ncbi:MAG TPA: hypothetical protein VFI47_17410 [Acidimicrobiales bacterium]|nr:hypothetical protein [Acidimicrobiales bacterium]
MAAKTSPYSTRFKLGAAAVVAVAVALFVGAFLTLGDSEDPVLETSGDAAVVEALLPARGDQVPQQSTVGIDLVPDWSGTLVVGGTEIPADELQVTPELGLIQFTPGEGRAVEGFDAGQNCVSAVIWPIADGRGVDDRTVNWCFTVV